MNAEAPYSGGDVVGKRRAAFGVMEGSCISKGARLTCSLVLRHSTKLELSETRSRRGELGGKILLNSRATEGGLYWLKGW